MSKFKNILDAANQSPEPETVKKKTKATKKSSPPIVDEKPEPVKKGRPKGKRSNPDFEQVTAYVRSKTYRQTKIALLQQEKLEDFSELVEELLTEWLSTQKGKSSNT
ncbi:MAG: hypothetical protein QNJ72_44165 [Pleurocapsa sp. MO_226.B13]|nr:hypothetical protein [Pleurocapsa sp. MO_226.B13]